LPDGTYICIPKIQIWKYFGGSWNGICSYILRPFGTNILIRLFCICYGPLVCFVGHLVYFFGFGKVEKIWQPWQQDGEMAIEVLKLCTCTYVLEVGHHVK
jgi:hypothetical protein